MKILKTIQNELTDYESKSVEISESVHRSAYKRIKRIAFFENRGGEDDKIDELGQYQYWLDPTKIYIDSTVKNLRIDTKNFLAFSINPVDDFAAVFTMNCALKEYLWDTYRDEQLKEDVEYYVGWGNALWEKTPEGYEACELTNTFVINQTARTVNDSAIITRYQMTQSDLKAKEGIWDNIEDVIKNCGNKTFNANRKTTAEVTTNPIYEIYKRDGEVSEEELFEAQGKKGGDKYKFVLARIITAGLTKADSKEEGKYVLFAEPFGPTKKMSDYYKEAHLGTYKGTWLREGIYETFFDYVVAIKDIDNQISEGLSWAGTILFGSEDNQTFQNVRTDIENGRIIKTGDLKQIDVRLENMDQLISRRNNLIEEMDKVAHTFDVIQGSTPPSGVPLGTTLAMNENAGKYFIHIRQKLTIAYKKIYKEWVLPKIIKDMKGQDIIRITGDANIVDQFRKLAVDSWYLKNLVKIGPHTPAMRDEIKAAKLAELEKFEPMIENVKEIWDGILQRIYITITGENMDMGENMATLTSLLTLEQDPVRRAFVLDQIYAAKNIKQPPKAQPVEQPQPEQKVAAPTAAPVA